jgi:phosphoglycolate phosphatase-like HAD superfamily hydrolase
MAAAFIFDIDGTLVDSVDLHARAWQEALAHFGYETPYEKVRGQIGKGGDQLLPVFVPADALDRLGDRIEKYRGDLFKRNYLPLVKSFPRVRDLFVAIKEDGYRIGLASSANADELQYYKQLANIADLVDVETSRSDVDRSKPCPDVFEAAVDRLKTAPAEAVVIGDTPYDAIAARRAGLKTIGVLCGGFPEKDLRDAGCLAIYRDPDELVERYGDLKNVLTLDRQTPSSRYAP